MRLTAVLNALPLPVLFLAGRCIADGGVGPGEGGRKEVITLEEWAFCHPACRTDVFSPLRFG